MSPIEHHRVVGGTLKASSKIELIAVSQLAQLAEDAAQCQRCPLYRSATQVVFGAGPTNASLMIVGEQPVAQSLVSSAICGRPFSSLRVLTTAHDFAFAVVSTKKLKTFHVSDMFTAKWVLARR